MTPAKKEAPIKVEPGFPNQGMTAGYDHHSKSPLRRGVGFGLRLHPFRSLVPFVIWGGANKGLAYQADKGQSRTITGQ